MRKPHLLTEKKAFNIDYLDKFQQDCRSKMLKLEQVSCLLKIQHNVFVIIMTRKFGLILIQSILIFDDFVFFQMLVQAYDMGTPRRTSSLNATVNIIVYRNQHAPSPAIQAVFQVQVEEIRPVGNEVQIVTFNDADTDVSIGSIIVKIRL